MITKPDATYEAHLNRACVQLTKANILDLVPFRVYVLDILSHQILYANTGHQAIELSGSLKCHDLFYRENRPCLSCKVTELVDAVGKPNGRVITSERFNEVEDCWFQLREGTLTLSDGRTAMYSVAIDISELKQMQNSLTEAHAELAFKNQQLESLTVTDTLTGLFNRRKLDEVLSHECARALRNQSPMTVILADIDKFKSVNDIHGHQVGDQLLIAIAKLLQQGVRTVDTVARWGGEEFMILCPSTTLSGACTVAENMRIAIEKYDFPVVGAKTCCFGVAEYRPGESPQAIIKRADEALYRAKNGGRNQVRAG